MASTMTSLSQKLYEAIESKNIGGCRYFLKQGANPNYLFPSEGMTAMHLAVGLRDENLAEGFVKLLLDHGRDPNVRSLAQLTPVHISTRWGNTRALKLLLKAGGDPYLVDEDGNNAWDLAKNYNRKEVVKVLDNETNMLLVASTFGKGKPSTQDLRSTKGLCSEDVSSSEDLFASDDSVVVEDLRTTAKVNHNVRPLLSLPIVYNAPGEPSTSTSANVRRNIIYSHPRSRPIIPPSFGDALVLATCIHRHLLERSVSSMEVSSYESDESRESSRSSDCDQKYCKELLNVIKGRRENEIKEDQSLEREMKKSFERDQRRDPRQTKNCFTYLLLDPRITKDLPTRDLMKPNRLEAFLEAIFYIGKGTRSRPLSHLHEAKQLMDDGGSMTEKIQRIVDIWSAGRGVISLSCFQNVTGEEAFTMEACMLEAIGLDNVTNIVNGTHYGIVRDWPEEDRQRLGAHLLHTAFCIHMYEGERQIRPLDL